MADGGGHITIFDNAWKRSKWYLYRNSHKSCNYKGGDGAFQTDNDGGGGGGGAGDSTDGTNASLQPVGMAAQI